MRGLGWLRRLWPRRRHQLQPVDPTGPATLYGLHHGAWAPGCAPSEQAPWNQRATLYGGDLW